MGRGLRWDRLPSRLQSGRAASSASKYKNKKTVVDGIEFDSAREAHHYAGLRLLEKAGEIRGLKLQVPLAIVIDNMHVCDYIADFVYEEKLGKIWDGAGERENWMKRVVDAKGMKTEIYRLKKKLVKAVLGIEIIEV